MSNLNTYENQEGYCIRATSRAYELYYRKLGFKQINQSGKKELTLAEIKKLLKDKGITFDPKAKREELMGLLDSQPGTADTGGNDAQMQGE